MCLLVLLALASGCKDEGPAYSYSRTFVSDEEDVYSGTIVDKTYRRGHVYRSNFWGVTDLGPIGDPVFSVQVQRDGDGWKRWFNVSLEAYENYEAGDHLKITNKSVYMEKKK